MVQYTGGARIGWVNASWPLAHLTAEEDMLSVDGAVIGGAHFEPEDVVAVERVVFVPVIAWGVRVVHVREDVHHRVIFWTFGNPNRVLRGIEAAGFVPAAPRDVQIPERPFAFRIPFLVAAIVAWNALFVLDVMRATDGVPEPGLGMLTGAALLFVTSVAVRFGGPVQRLALRDPSYLPRALPLLNLITFVSAILTAAFAWAVFTGG